MYSFLFRWWPCKEGSVQWVGVTYIYMHILLNEVLACLVHLWALTVILRCTVRIGRHRPKERSTHCYAAWCYVVGTSSHTVSRVEGVGGTSAKCNLSQTWSAAITQVLVRQQFTFLMATSLHAFNSEKEGTSPWVRGVMPEHSYVNWCLLFCHLHVVAVLLQYLHHRLAALHSSRDLYTHEEGLYVL